MAGNEAVKVGLDEFLKILHEIHEDELRINYYGMLHIASRTTKQDALRQMFDELKTIMEDVFEVIEKPITVWNIAKLSSSEKRLDWAWKISSIDASRFTLLCIGLVNDGKLQEHIEDWIKNRQQAELDLQNTKGIEYSGEDHVFTNFEEAAEYLGLTPYQVIGVHIYKHFKAIESYCKIGTVKSESIISRIDDMRLYLALLYVMVDWINYPKPACSCACLKEP